MRNNIKSLYARVFLGGSMCLLWGCSLALDTDVLQKKHATDTDTVPPPTPECVHNVDCADYLNCTIDQCNASQKCVHVLNHASCGEFEMCDVQQGCIPTGDNCDEQSDCEDYVDCTIDICFDGQCRNSLDHSLCKNSVPFCRETALCIPEQGGCVEGAEILCDAPAEGICVVAQCNVNTGDCDVSLSPGADNDSDSALDALCGGDDCDDTRADVFKGAEEYCDGADNNCDGATDAIFNAESIETIASDPSIASPAVALNGSHIGILWDMAGVQAAIRTPDGNILTENLSDWAAGTLSHWAITPDPTQTDAFYVVYAHSVDGSSETLQVIRLAISDGGDALTTTAIASLSHQLTTTITDTIITYDDTRTNPGWMVLWSETDNANGYLRFQRHDMIQALDVCTTAGSISEVSMDISSMELYSVAFAANDINLAGGNYELFSAKIQGDIGVSDSSQCKVISVADNDNQGSDDNDPSVAPSLAADDETATSAVAYVDYTGFGVLKTATLWRGDSGEIIDLVDTAVNDEFTGLQLWHDGDKWVAAYIRKSGSGSHIVLDEFRLSAAPSAGINRIARVNLRTAAPTEGEYSGMHFAGGSNRQLALVWVENTEATARLQLALARTCTP